MEPALEHRITTKRPDFLLLPFPHHPAFLRDCLAMALAACAVYQERAYQRAVKRIDV